MTTNLRAALAGAAGAAALILLSLYLWPVLNPEPHVERYESMPRRLLFDFNSTENRTQSLTVDFDLGPAELKGMDKAQIFVTLSQRELGRYPDTASGSLRCLTLIFINEQEWYRESMSFDYSASHPAEWPRSHDEVVGHAYTGQAPHSEERTVATDKLDPSGVNPVRATVTCTSHVESTGPTQALLEFGPLTAVVTS
jgi:hypothetical protein